jgi:hypothetical protein
MVHVTLSAQNGRVLELFGVLAEFVEFIRDKLDCLPTVSGDGRIEFILHKNHPLAEGIETKLATIMLAEPPGQTRIEVFLPLVLTNFRFREGGQGEKVESQEG